MTENVKLHQGDKENKDMKLWKATLTLKPNSEGEWGEYVTEFNFEYRGDNWEKLTIDENSTYHQVSGNAILNHDYLSDTIRIQKHLVGYIVTRAFERELKEYELKHVERDMLDKLADRVVSDYRSVLEDYNGKKMAIYNALDSHYRFNPTTEWEQCNECDIDECALCGSEEASDYFICEECGCKCCEHCSGDDSLCLECADKYATCDFCGNRVDDYSVCAGCGETMCWQCTGAKTDILCEMCEENEVDPYEN